MRRKHRARTTARRIRRCAALLVLLGASDVGLAYNIYKSVDAQGNVTYSSSPPADTTMVERVKLAPAPSKDSLAAAKERERQIVAAGNQISTERKAQQETQAKGVDAARQEVNNAQAALADAKVMRDSDWQGTVQGKRHLKPEYFARVQAAESRLAQAQKAYKDALARRGN
jgi:hypothetical protein